MSFLGRDVHGVLGDDLLTLTERDVVEVSAVRREAELLSEFLDVLERVNARRQDEEDRYCRAGLLERFGKLHLATLDVLGAQLLFDVGSVNKAVSNKAALTTRQSATRQLCQQGSRQQGSFVNKAVGNKAALSTRQLATIKLQFYSTAAST